MLAQQSGSIINIASIGAFIAYPHAIAYLQSKGGVMQLTRGLALEWRDRNVRVNAIAPTLMDTALIERMDKTTSITSDFIVNRMLRDRLGKPELSSMARQSSSPATRPRSSPELPCRWMTVTWSHDGVAT